MADQQQLENFIWQIADLLRGPYRPPQYERVMLPMTVLRRFDCVLAPTKAQVLAEYERRKNKQTAESILDPVLNSIAGQRFHNHSPFSFEGSEDGSAGKRKGGLKGDPNNIDRHLTDYINGFSQNVREIFERFEFTAEIEKMREANILYLVVSKFCDIDLHPNAVGNGQMGSLFENLIRRFNEAANETAGDHFTPREVIELMVDILFDPDDDILTQPVIRKMLDPACGTGGMLAEAQNYLRRPNGDKKQANLYVFGQDFNPRAYAIAASDLLMKGNEKSDIRYGDTLTDDQFPSDDPLTNGRFDYLIANPPFGVDWKKQNKDVKLEHNRRGFAGRFGAGLPRVNDGSLLFLQHMISKFEPYAPEQKKNGSRLAIVFNGSPLFTGGAGSGESEIRKWVIENDWLEAIVAMPEQMFYNTGIGTYVWVVTNRKQKHRKGKIQLIDARERWQAMRRSLGDKRRKMGAEDIAITVREYGKFVETETSKLFDNEDFGYNRVPIERPLRLLYEMSLERKSDFLDAAPHLLDDVQAIDKQLGRSPRTDWNEFDALMQRLLKQRESKWKKSEQKLFRDVFTEKEPEAAAVIAKERKAKREPDARVWGWFLAADGKLERMYEPDTKLRDFENVQLKDEVVRYFCEEVEPHVGDAWADGQKIRSAYEINFNRYFYEYTPPRPLEEIDADLREVEEKIIHLLREVIG
ncbi:class I SAM-dependent DNA methyltransferase [Leptolyngbya sp. BC1307]|uniref:type I restriction-modification system subunit M n=1 Tax=Leptolyngbya sp. BC1307 TaxID=2029589 RepID=UPI000EFD957C|nr:class I SAM-dependent DNA methyltransferase [Leptolyngbya sp. BC1307]